MHDGVTRIRVSCRLLTLMRHTLRRIFTQTVIDVSVEHNRPNLGEDGVVVGGDCSGKWRQPTQHVGPLMPLLVRCWHQRTGAMGVVDML